MQGFNEAQTWYSGPICEKTKAGKLPLEIKVGNQLSVVKPLHAKWVTKVYHYIRSKPEILCNGWRKSKMIEHINKKIEVDPFKDI